MNPKDEKVELFRALEVHEVEERAQHVIVSTLSSDCGYGYPTIL